MKPMTLSDSTMPNSFLEMPNESATPANISPKALSKTPPYGSATDQKMLVYRLSEAARRIREETELIRRSTFSESGARLMRILGETVEEQRQALRTRDGSVK